MVRSPLGWCRNWTDKGSWLLLGLIALGAFPGPGRAADVETRDFKVSVDNKPAGDAHMTFNRQDDGTITMSCDTDVTVRFLLIKYTYSYRGREVWKGGRLQRFDSTCNDDGKRYTVAAVAEADKLRVRVNNEEKTAPADVWLTSYWSQPDNKRINKVVAILDADTGKDLSGRVQFLGVEQRPVAGDVQNVNHFRLQGTANVDLWYDAAGRLVRQEWVEQGHRTLLELSRIRR